MPGPQVAQEVLSKNLRPVIPRRTPVAFAELIEGCWGREASGRPDFGTIINNLERMRLQ